MVIFRCIPRESFDAWRAQWYLVNLPPLVSAQLGGLPRFSRRSVFEQVFHAYALDNDPVPAEQAAIAAPVPKAPAQAHTLVPAEDDLAAHLADREVEQGVVAWLAGQAGATPYHLWCVERFRRITPLGAPAERAEERLRPGRRRDAVWKVREGVTVGVARSRMGRVSITGRGHTV